MKNDFSKSIALLIPTKNRAESIQYYLQERGEEIINSNIDIVIYDSSENDDTHSYVESFNERMSNKIEYYKVSDDAYDIHGTQKIIKALIATAEEYDYVWLCGDQTLLNLSEFLDRVRACMEEKYDLIHVYRNEDGIDDKEFTDEKDFFVEFFWSMTHFCSFILSRNMIFDMKEYIDDYLNSGGINPIVFSIFALLAERRHRIYYISVNKLFDSSPYRTMSYAYTKKDMINGWIKMLYHGFHYLPSYYDAVKPQALKSVKKNIRILSFLGAMRMRATGNIDLHKYLENKKEIAYMAGCPLWWIRAWAIMPIPFTKLALTLGVHIAKEFGTIKKTICNIRMKA